MLTNIEIDGFKSLEDIHLEIKPITVLIGLNSSGKSSVLQILEILKQSVEREFSDLNISGPLANLGSFKDIVSKRRIKKELDIAVGGIRNQNLEFPFSKKTEYGYDFTVNARGIKAYGATLKSGDFELSTSARRRGSLKKKWVHFGKNQRILFQDNFGIGRPFKYNSSKELPDDFDYDMITQKFLEVIAQDLKDFRLVPATRGITCPAYPLANASSEDLVDTLNPYVQAQKLSSSIVYDSTFIERKINPWLKQITGVEIRARTVPNKQASIEASRKYPINLINEGFGTNQLVHLFAQIVKSPVNAIIGIEEPEVHLHPKAQSELAKVLIKISQEEKKNLIITTHSEHILYRILTEIGKETLKPQDLALYHFKLTDDGITQVERLKPDEKGRLDKGIPDFLDTDLNEFRDFLEALKG